MKNHQVRVHAERSMLPKKDQLAYKIAEMASDLTPPGPEVRDMIINRLIDNTACGVAALNRGPVMSARAQALCHPVQKRGASVLGLSSDLSFSMEWAAFANGTAVRELDFHDTYLAADYSHPADTIPPLLAVAQGLSLSGEDLIRGIAVAYETQISLVRGICLHKHKKDHIAHLGPAVAAGLGAMLRQSPDITCQAIGQALHTTCTTRQSRKGEISGWKACAPGFAGKMAIEAMDRAMRGEKAPAPIYEGEDSVIAWMLDGPDACYTVSLPEAGEEKRSVLSTWTKEYSAEYQAQAFIDLAFRLREKVGDLSKIKSVVIHTSHHTHYVIGTGSGDPQKNDPYATRETLDHSLSYIFAVALVDGEWHHEKSYSREKTESPLIRHIWERVSTLEDPTWTARYHHPDPSQKAFGGRATITLQDGSVIGDELPLARAHPHGSSPFVRKDYVKKFTTLTGDFLSPQEAQSFLEAAQNLSELQGSEFRRLFPCPKKGLILLTQRDERGLF